MNKKNGYHHSFKKLDHKAFCASWAGILSIYFLSMFLWQPMEVHGVFIPLPEAQNSHFEPADYEIPTIRLYRDGSVFLDDQIVEDQSKLPDMIEAMKDENKWGTGNKVLLKADSYLKFGRVVEILDILKRNGIKVVGLVTNENASLADFNYKEIRTINSKE